MGGKLTEIQDRDDDGDEGFEADFNVLKCSWAGSVCVGGQNVKVSNIKQSVNMGGTFTRAPVTATLVLPYHFIDFSLASNISTSKLT